jgi:hypothetical protein
MHLASVTLQQQAVSLHHDVPNRGDHHDAITDSTYPNAALHVCAPPRERRLCEACAVHYGLCGLSLIHRVPGAQKPLQVQANQLGAL